MKYLIIKNLSEKDINNYPIEEAKLDQDGNVVYNNEGSYDKTGRTLEWSIKSGETARFPKYVADYLMYIYGFLKEQEETKENIVEEAVEEKIEEKTSSKAEDVPLSKPQEGNINCKYCGKPYKNSRALGMHIGIVHADKLI